MRQTKAWSGIMGWLALVASVVIPAGGGGGGAWAWPVPDSGQTTSYAAGDDGAYSLNPRSYAVNNDGTVTDNVTRLMWQQQDDGQTRDWAAAKGYCQGLSLAGFADWRLPTAQELATVVDYGKVDPAIDQSIFLGTQPSSGYWSSTYSFSHPSGVGFIFGNVNFQDQTWNNYVRCVRSETVSRSFGPLVINPSAATATDVSTGLAWQRLDNVKSWQDALSYCEGLALDGFNDWRLPTVNELFSLVDTGTESPAIYDGTVFPSTLSSNYFHWSSTVAANYINSGAWGVNFTSGNTGSYSYQTYSGAVRCVRSGPINTSIDAIAITSPAQATTMPLGTTQTLGWAPTGLGGQVAIALSRQGGTEGSWEEITPATDNDGSYEWPVSGPESMNCVLKVEPLAAPDKVGYKGLFSIAAKDALTIVPTVRTNFTTYTLALAEHYSNGAFGPPIDPAAALWTLSDPATATLSGSTLTAKKNGVITVTAVWQGQTASQTLFLVDPQNPDDLEGINDTIDQADPLPEGVFWQGQVLTADQDWFQITLEQQAIIAVDFTSPSPSAEVAIDILDTTGETVLAHTLSSNGGRQTLRCGLNPGSYHLRLTPAGDIDEEAFYTLAWATTPLPPFDIEANNTPAAALALTQGLPVHGLLPAGDSDFFSFAIPQPGLLRFTLSSESATADYTLTLFKKGNEEKVLQQMTMVNGAKGAWDVGLAAGDYVIRVTGADPDPQAVYTLTWSSENPAPGLEIEPNDTLTTANGLAPAASRQGRIAAADDTDLYGFTMVTATETALKVTLTPSAPSASYTIELLNGIGTPLASKSSVDGNAAFVLLKLPAGSYFFRVSSGGEVDPLVSYSVAMTTSAQVTALARLGGIQATAASATLAVNQTLPITVTATWSDAASLEVSGSAAFTSSDPSVLTVAPGGQVTGIKEGHAQVTVAYQDKATTIPLTVGAPQATAKQGYGNLIIVAGGTLTAADSLKAATLHISELAYQKFQARNFEDEDIYFLTQTPFHDLNGDGYDDQIVDDPTPTKEEVLSAITGWAPGQSSSGPLYLYLADHGAPQSFQVASGQILTAALLKEALDSFQKATGRPVVVIIEACYSGSFVAPLANPAYDRLVLTSVDAQHPGYLSTDGATSFSAFLLAHLYQGNSIAASLAQVKTDLAAIGLPYQKMVPQLAGSEGLQYLQVGGDFALAGIFPELTNTTASQAITAGQTLHLSAQATSLLGGLSAWAVIVPPDYTPPEVSGDFISPVDELPTVPLADEDPSTKMMDGTYLGSFAAFTYNGVYQVIFYAKDGENNLVKSAPVTITVSGGQELPAPSGDGLTLGLGWNLVSSRVEIAVATTFADPQAYTSVWKWEQGQWAVFLPGETPQGSYAASKGFGALAAITPGEGFWVHANTAQQVGLSGLPVTGPLAFTAGWNLLGLKGDQPSAVAEIVAAKEGIASIWKWENNSWSVYLPNEATQGEYAASKGFSALTTITPGEGFWVNVQ